MTRKQERRRRVAQWAGIVGCSAVLALVVWRVAGSPIAALVIIAIGLAVAHRRMIGAAGVPVLTYHSVSPNPSWLPWAQEIAVHPDTFERHLATLRRMKCNVIGTRNYVATRLAGDTLPYRTVLLHFDDGYRDNWLHAVPALRRHGFAGTFFASLDFVEPGDTVRPPDGDDSGYMNWAELRAIEDIPLLEVEPHGVDHARVPVSDRIVGRVTADNWRELAWLQWAATPGPKHDWFRHAEPPAVPIGSPVPESALALAAPQWRDGQREEMLAMEARITRDLARCRTDLSDRISHLPQIFCWPENAVGPEGRRIAADLGYLATTGGRGRNTADEPPHVISRIHMGDRAIGIRIGALEALHLRAAVCLAQGNHYWYLVIGPMNFLRRIVSRLRHAA
ncbi:polysaccharide deacetylase family protein [Sphingomonas endolithica]|uniref:polysaccharide deacetylase family protein n=1 Tax=Sphingomonas endolithica TaxID=2972485 RepID=UPI0021AE6E84|nr:polysaccharide deacetylase family protein [Sphingomonas sp. ZFBP2030]